jgi:hypothetical protein
MLPNMLVFGPPGCGKSLIVKATVGEANVGMVRLDGEFLCGYSPGKLRRTLEPFQSDSPCALVLTHIDELLSVLSSEDEEYLFEDLFKQKHRFIRPCFATSRRPVSMLLADLDRFQIFIPMWYPVARDRMEILRRATPALGVDQELLESISEVTEWWSGRELVALVESSMDRSRRGPLRAAVEQELGRIALEVDVPTRRRELAETLAFASRRCQRTPKFDTMEKWLAETSGSTRDADLQWHSRVLAPPDEQTEAFKFYVSSREIPKPRDELAEKSVALALLRALDLRQNIETLPEMRDGSVTPWIAYQIGHWADGEIAGGDAEAASFATNAALNVAEVSGDVTRIFAALLTRAEASARAGDLVQVIADCRRITNYPSFQALHERALAHLNLARAYSERNEWHTAIRHFDLGVRCLVARMPREICVLVARQSLKAYQQAKDIVGLAFCLKTLLPQGFEESLATLEKAQYGLEKTLSYAARARALGMEDVAQALSSAYVKSYP